MVNGDDVRGDAGTLGAGDDTRLVALDRAACCPVPVRFVHGGRLVVLQVAAQIQGWRPAELGRQDGHDLLGRHHRGATLVVDDLGF